MKPYLVDLAKPSDKQSLLHQQCDGHSGLRPNVKLSDILLAFGICFGLSTIACGVIWLVVAAISRY